MDPRPEWSTLPSLLCTSSFFRTPMRVMDFYRGRRTCFPSAVDFTFGNRIVYFIAIVVLFRGVTEYRGGRTCFPTAFEYMHVVTSQYLCNFTALVYDVRMHFLLLFFKFQVAWSGVRIVSFSCSVFSAELERSRWLVAFPRIPSRTGCPLSTGFLRPQSTFTPCMP